ncbi:MAG: M15 family metallopeptidase [Coleofasciculaceae cyanobacterium]
MSPADNLPEDDIPAALRDTPEAKKTSRLSRPLLIITPLALGAIALITFLLLPQFQTRQTSASSNQVTADGTSTETSSTTDNDEVDNILGHLPYEEAPASELRSISLDGRIRLRRAATEKFKAMSAAASRDGITLVPLSGFRSLTEQEYLFFEVKAERGQVASKRAEVSAPPGYSEHHTGYAVDIGDANVPATNLSPEFENTAAFKWLEENAAYYSFELSFPEGNPQGISYEPWHWRFVGDIDSLKTFHQARDLETPASNGSTEPEELP